MNLRHCIILIFSISIVLLYQNCSAPSTFTDLAVTNDKSNSPLVSQGNGDGYLGKPDPTEYVKSNLNFNCLPSELTNIQGASVVSGSNLIISKDNCIDTTFTVPLTDNRMNFKPYNPDFILFSNVPYEKGSSFRADSQLATEVFCRDAQDTKGIDIVAKIRSSNSATVKIYSGELQFNGVWNSRLLLLSNVSRSVGAVKTFSQSGFRLTIDGTSNSAQSYNGQLTAQIDGKEINQSVRCYQSSSAPTLPSLSEVGLVGIWPFNGSATDISANNLISSSVDINSTIAYVPGYLGQAIRLDGVDDHVSIPPGPVINNLASVSIAAWVWPVDFGGIVRKSNAGFASTSGWNFIIPSSTQRLMFQAAFSGGGIQFESVYALTPLTWNHVAVTWDGSASSSSVKFFVNGVQIGTTLNQPGSGNRMDDSAQPLQIGDIYDYPGRRFQGQIDQLMIWNRVLNNQEVLNIYRNGVTIQ